jgi:prephenate dehydratase
VSPPTRVAIQGVRGAFSHEAACRLLGEDVQVVECRDFDDVFEAVMSVEADAAAVPVENTLAGAVQPAMDLLARHPLHAVAEVRIAVRLCLIAPPGCEEKRLRKVGSHPVALQQCRRFFRERTSLEPVVAFDTAGSVRDLMAGRAHYDAAVASSLSAEIWGARVIETDLEDESHNYTRFLLLRREPFTPPTEGAKTSLAWTLPHRPGSLHEALGTFAERGVDLTRLESRPIPGRPWEYRFFADVRGARLDLQDAAVDALRALAVELRVLGRYVEEVH